MSYSVVTEFQCSCGVRVHALGWRSEDEQPCVPVHCWRCSARVGELPTRSVYVAPTANDAIRKWWLEIASQTSLDVRGR